MTPRAVKRAERAIGADMRRWRQLQKLTASEVADRAGVSPDTVGRLERGEGVTFENMLRIARALGVIDLLTAAVDPYESAIGRLRSEEVLPERVRRSGKDTS